MTTINVTSLQRQSEEVGYLNLPMYEYVSAIAHGIAGTSQIVWTAAAGAEFPRGQTRWRFPIDTSRYDEVRWSFYVETLGAGSLQLKFSTTATGSLVDIVSGGVSLSIASTGLKDSTWGDLNVAGGAQADGLYLAVDSTGVSGASRTIIRMTAEFRAKPA